MEKTCVRPASILIVLAFIITIATESSAAETTITQPIRTYGYGSLVSGAFSPDGLHVATCGGSGVYLWDLLTEQPTLLSNMTSPAICFSPDGTKVFTGYELLEIATGRSLSFADSSRNVRSVAFSPDGKSVLTGSYDEIDLWNALTGEVTYTFPYSIPPGTAVAFSPDGKFMMAGDHLWDAGTGSLIRSFMGHTNHITSIAFSPDGSRILTGGDTAPRIWETATGTLLRTLDAHSIVQTVAYSPDGTLMLTSHADQTTRLWDAKSGSCIRTFGDSANRVYGASFSPNADSILAVGSGKVCLWDTATGACRLVLAGHSSYRQAAPSPDGRSVLLANGTTAELLDLDSGSLIRSYYGHSNMIEAVAFSPDGSRVLTGSSDGTSRLWETQTGSCLRIFTTSASCVAFSPDGSRILTGYEKAAQLWNAADGSLIRAFSGNGTVFSVAFSPDGIHVLTVSDNLVMLWDSISGLCVRTFDNTGYVYDLDFSPDGTRFVCACSDYLVRLWDVNTGSRIRVFAGGVRYAVDYSSDGERVLTANSDRTAKLWDIATGLCIRTFVEGYLLSDACFLPDGLHILTTTGGAAKLWSAKPMLTVKSAPAAGVSIAGDFPGITDYSVEFDSERVVALAASETASFEGKQRDFVRWFIDEVEMPVGQSQIQIPVGFTHTAIAAYETHLLSVRSEPPGIAIGGDKPGLTDYAVVCYAPRVVNLSAETIATVNNVFFGAHYNLVRWVVDGEDQPDGQGSLTVTMDRDHTVCAIYAIQQWTLTVDSQPLQGVCIEGTNPGTTSYTCICDDYQEVTLKAPESFERESGTITGEFTFADWTWGSILGKGIAQNSIRHDANATACYTHTLYVSPRYTPGNEFGTWLHPYGTIQNAVDHVVNEGIIIIEDGVYNEDVSWVGKSLELRGTGPSRCVIQGKLTVTALPGHPIGLGGLTASGLTITGIVTCSGSMAELTNCSLLSQFIALAEFLPDWKVSSYGLLLNCTLSEILAKGASVDVESSIIMAAGITADVALPPHSDSESPEESSIHISFSCLSGGPASAKTCCREYWTPTWDWAIMCGYISIGTGNIFVDPLFADPANGDYHLKSQYGRWDPASQSWVNDAVTSPCIDAGHPAADYSNEPQPNNSRINMGAYGNTPEASRSRWTIFGDTNDDCRVNALDLIFVRTRLHTDAHSGDNWKADVNGDGRINVLDLILLRNRIGAKCR